MKKSQSAIEFVFLITFMLVIVVGFFSASSSKILDSVEGNNQKIAEDIADLAYREIEVATSVNNGYVRNFTLPLTVNGANYSISLLQNRELVVNYLGTEHVKFLPSNIVGSISPGINTITKQGGIVQISLGTYGSRGKL